MNAPMREQAREWLRESREIVERMERAGAVTRPAAPSLAMAVLAYWLVLAGVGGFTFLLAAWAL